MKQRRNRTGTLCWLAGSLCIWLLCAWVVQQPAPAKRAPTKAPPATPARRPLSAKKATRPEKAATMATAPEATTALNAQGLRVDTESGLALDETMPLVKGQCTACHSSKLVLQSHFDRDKWIERIRWMQRTQKLWDLGDTEKSILDYLVKHYGPLPVNFDGRRLPLDAPRWHTR